MQVEPGRVATIVYRVKTDEGRILDQVFSDAPLVYLHGSARLLPRVETQIVGMRPGQRATFRLEPLSEPAKLIKKSQLKIPRDELPEGVVPEVGVALVAEGPIGSVHLWIREVRSDVIILDTRHPSDGLPLTVSVEILGVREATDEERKAGRPLLTGSNERTEVPQP